MKYLQMFNNLAEAINFKKHIMAEADPDRHMYTIIYGEKKETMIFSAPAVADKIVYECNDHEADSDSYNIIRGLIAGRLLGNNYDYEHDTIISESDLKNVESLGNVFAGSIKNKQMENSAYPIRNFTSFEKFTSVTSIDGIIDGEYKNCFGMLELEYINIPKSVKEIGNSAFAFCLNLTEIKMHNEINAIRVKAFYNCATMSKIEIPESVTVIENNAFNKCDNLNKIIMKSDKPCKIYKDSFTGISPKCHIYVPANAVDTYKAQWKNYADLIKSI